MGVGTDEERVEELHAVRRNRYLEARHAGLEHPEALRFACSDTDIAELRTLVAGGCAPGLIARIVL